MEKGKCVYCGMELPKGIHICSECSKKRKLVRTLQQMVRDTFERVRKGV